MSQTLRTNFDSLREQCLIARTHKHGFDAAIFQHFYLLNIKHIITDYRRICYKHYKLIIIFNIVQI